ncbi:hypothetical protein [Streptomyces sirii]|uniref:hypothetical protein n=1 Tax=Streptomyces sirii TaxID=3127701 RepID=UPI003D35C89A
MDVDLAAGVDARGIALAASVGVTPSTEPVRPLWVRAQESSREESTVIFVWTGFFAFWLTTRTS